MDYRQMVRTEASRLGVDPNIAEALMVQESAGNPRAVSRAGAQGLLQLMPGTARELGVDPNDPAQNIQGGLRYLKQQMDRYGTAGGLAAYNAGPGRVGKTENFSDLPGETRDYVPKILNRAAMIAEKNQGAPAPDSGPGLDALMRGFEKAQAAGDASAAQELGAAIKGKLSQGLEKARAAGDEQAAGEFQGLLGRFGAPQATTPAPQAQKPPVAAPKAPEKPKVEPSMLAKVGRGVDDFVRGAADTLTFGLADEFAAKMDSLVGGGQSGKKDYDQALAAQRERDKEGGAARIAGQVSGGLVPVVKGVQAANSASRLARAGAGAVTGAVQGGLYGFGSGEGDLADRAESAVGGALVGGALGGGVGALLPAATRQVANDFIKRSGNNEAAAIDAEIVKRLASVKDNPNFRGQPVRAEQLNAVANQFVKEAQDGVKAVGGQKPLQDALSRWKALSGDEIAALRGTEVGDAVADSITQAQRVRSLTAEKEANNGILAKAVRTTADILPLPQTVRLGIRSMAGGQESRKVTTETLLKPKNLAAADEVLQRLGPSQASKASDTLQGLVSQAAQRVEAQKAAKLAARQSAKASTKAASDPAVLIAEQQAKDPSYIIGLGNKLGAPRNEAQMAEFSKVLKNQMEAREAQKELQRQAALAAKGGNGVRNEVLATTRTPISGAFQEILPGGRSNLGLSSREAIEALRTVKKLNRNTEVGKAADQILKSGNVPEEAAFYGLQNQLRRLQEKGLIPKGQVPASQGTAQAAVSPRVASYNSTVDSANKMADLARSSAPSQELAMFASDVATTKNPGEKAKMVMERLKNATPDEQAYLQKFVLPLTKFGKKN